MWSTAFLGAVIIISALFVCFSLNDTIMDENIDRSLRLWLYKHYGNGLLGAYTLFEVTLAGCWPNYFRPLIERVSGLWAIFVVLYISGVVFALIRIITALFLKSTMQVADQDAEKVMNDLMKKKKAYIRKLRAVFQAMDVSQDGNLNWSEFRHIITNPDVKTWCSILELEVADAEMLFELLDDDGSGDVSYDEFLNGVTRLKGQARSLDLVSVMRSVEGISKDMGTLQTTVDELRLRIQPLRPRSAVRFPSESQAASVEASSTSVIL